MIQFLKEYSLHKYFLFELPWVAYSLTILVPANQCKAGAHLSRDPQIVSYHVKSFRTA